MVRGFSLIELLITVVIVLILIAATGPDFSRVREQQSMRSLAAQLQGFIHYAKAQAVLRRQNLWGHIELGPDQSDRQTLSWRLTLSDSDTAGAGEPLMSIGSDAFRAIGLRSTFPRNRIQFDGRRGKISNGSLYFQPRGGGRQVLRLSTSFGASRVLVCTQQGPGYGFPACDG